MKHLFYVHSHITFLVSKQYVFDKGINPDDCLFFCVREYKLPERYRSLFKNVLSYPIDVLPNGSLRILENYNIIDAYRNIKLLEEKINDYFNKDTFIYYVPNAQSDCSSAIITMSQCKRFMIIEEGCMSYASKDVVPCVFIGVKLYLYYFIRIFFYRILAVKNWRLPYNHKKFYGTIAMSSGAFYDTSGEKMIVSNPFDREELSIVPDAILSIDASLPIFFTKETVVDLYIRLLKFFKSKGYTKVAYKFHPNFYFQHITEEYREIIHNTFGELVYELPSETVIENILNTYDVAFYSDYSSIALYASFLGRKSWSYARFLTSFNEKYAQQIKKADKILQYYTDISGML